MEITIAIMRDGIDPYRFIIFPHAVGTYNFDAVNMKFTIFTTTYQISSVASGIWSRRCNVLLERRKRKITIHRVTDKTRSTTNNSYIILYLVARTGNKTYHIFAQNANAFQPKNQTAAA